MKRREVSWHLQQSFAQTIVVPVQISLRQLRKHLTHILVREGWLVGIDAKARVRLLLVLIEGHTSI